MKFIQQLFKELNKIEGKITPRDSFLKSEVSEIIKATKKENLPFLDIVLNMNKLSVFDASLILSRKNLSLEKIEIIKKAINIYTDKGLEDKGETLSDFISKVCANLDMLNAQNINYFREIASIRNDIYDFSNMLATPINKIEKKEYRFAFEKVLID